jgi:Uma2 family endonuclease
MSAVMNAPRFADAEAYLAWEAMQPERHEYVDGEIYAMSGAQGTHNDITLNAIFFLRQALKGTPCKANGIDLKLQVNAKGDHLYPDVLVTCDPRDSRSIENRFISHPWLVAEVLSDSTAAYDRGRKFELYRSIETLTHYLLIEQTRPYAELFFKNAQGLWVLQPLHADDMIPIDRLGQPWPVASLFEDVDFTPASPPAAPPPDAH